MSPFIYGTVQEKKVFTIAIKNVIILLEKKLKDINFEALLRSKIQHQQQSKLKHYINIIQQTSRNAF